jgi:adenylate cyclase
VIELERKFLISEPPAWLERCPSEPIEQAYLAVSGDWELRVRRIGERTVMTVKHGSGERRTEVEVDIGADQFETLRSLSDRAVAKRRHYVEDGGATIEVDVYEGDLEGLVVGEVEFDSQQAADEFEPPSWLGDEVTGDERYANKRLATDGLPAPGAR